MLMSVALRRLEDAIQARIDARRWPRVAWQSYPRANSISLVYIARRRDFHAFGKWSSATFWNDSGGDFIASNAGFQVIEKCPNCDGDWFGEGFLEGVFRVVPIDGSGLEDDLPSGWGNQYYPY